VDATLRRRPSSGQFRQCLGRCCVVAHAIEVYGGARRSLHATGRRS
jgi:hypothetical protein